MNDHTVRAYDQDLHELMQLATDMGGLVEKQLRDAIEALTRADGDLAERVVSTDAKVDALERQIEDLAIQLIARRAPLASDLREIVAALRIAIDLERVGDSAKGIGKRFAALADGPHPHHLMGRIGQMAELAQAQIKDVLDSYARRDVAQAMTVWNHDEEIDLMYTSIFRELLTYMMEDPRNITFSTHLLFCAKNIERVGDHATNIAETVYFMIKGEMPKGDRPRGGLPGVALA